MPKHEWILTKNNVPMSYFCPFGGDRNVKEIIGFSWNNFETHPSKTDARRRITTLKKDIKNRIQTDTMFDSKTADKLLKIINKLKLEEVV